MFAALFLIPLTFWFDMRAKERRNELPSIALEKLRRLGIPVKGAMAPKSPHDIWTASTTFVLGSSIIISALAIGSGGGIPFALFGV